MVRAAQGRRRRVSLLTRCAAQPGKVRRSKKPTTAPYGKQASAPEPAKENPLFPARPRSFRVGGDVRVRLGNGCATSRIPRAPRAARAPHGRT